MDSVVSCVKCRTVYWRIEYHTGMAGGCPMCRMMRNAEWNTSRAKEVICVPCAEDRHDQCVRPCVCRVGRKIGA
jgi:hypothetical protein